MYYIVDFTVFDEFYSINGLSLSTVVKADSEVEAERMIYHYWYRHRLAKMISIDSVREYHLLTNKDI